MNCAHCGDEKETKPGKAGPKLPRGWKYDPGGKPVCRACWKQRYVLRAITVPVSGPIEGSWEDLREDLAAVWAQSTAAANWAARELYVRDVRRAPGLEKLPPMSPVYLYGLAKDIEEFQAVPRQSLSSLLQSVERKYRAKRYALLWTRAESLPTYRYPMPFPVHNQSWKLSESRDGVLELSVRIADRRWRLRLRGGPGFRRARVALRKIIRGEAIKGEVALYRARASSGDHRTTIEGRGPGGAPRRPSSVMAKMVAWLPRQESPDHHAVMHVYSTSQEFLVVDVEDRERQWVLHADHVRRWIAAHRSQLQRWSDDQKAERRRRRDRAALNDRRDRACQKQRNRLKSFCQESACQLGRFARRQRVGGAIIDLSCKEYFPSFPWFEFERILIEKLDELGIANIPKPSAPVVSETA